MQRLRYFLLLLAERICWVSLLFSNLLQHLQLLLGNLLTLLHLQAHPPSPRNLILVFFKGTVISRTETEISSNQLGKPQLKKCRVYLGIAQIAIAPPPPHSNRHSGALYFRTDLSKCHLNFNFHCISAPNHTGKGSDSPKNKQMPIWTWTILP